MTIAFLEKRYYLIPIILIIGVGLLFILYKGLSYAKNITIQQELIRQQEKIKNTKYNEYGLPERQEISDQLLYETDNLYIYSDRAVKKLTISSGNAGYFAKAINAFAISFGQRVKISAMPVPLRVQFEPVSGNSNQMYRRFFKGLESNLTKRVKAVDCSELIRENGGRNNFYRTEAIWTMPGAYYGYRAYMEAMGKEPYPEDHFILYQNNVFLGSLYTEVHKLNGIYRNIHQIANYFPEDPFIFRLAKNFKNYETVRDNEAGEEYKRPVVIHTTPGSDSIVGNNIDYAIFPGNGEGCLILIADNAGKSMAPYFTEHYENVVFFILQNMPGKTINR